LQAMLVLTRRMVAEVPDVNILSNFWLNKLVMRQCSWFKMHKINSWLINCNDLSTGA
jgi:hypothetical protein